jgi:hypothetical protein
MKLIPLLFLLTGCATCREYPVVCGTVTGIVTYSLISSFNHDKIALINHKETIQPIHGDMR